MASERSFKASQANREDGKQRNNTGRRINNYKHNDSNNAKAVSSGEVLMIGENRKSPDVGKVKCIYCKEQHWSDECNKYKTAEERRRHLKRSCFKFLKEGHMSKECKSKKLCVHCGSFNAHHRSLSPKKFDVKKTEANVAYECSNMIEESAETKSTELPALVSTNELVIMQTAKVKVGDTNRDNWENVRRLMDSGSQRSYITESLTKRLKLRLEDDQEIHLEVTDPKY